MALIECPECKREISSEATFCPHCGFPLKKNTEAHQDNDVVNVKIIKEENNSKYSNIDINKYQKEIYEYKSRSKTDKNAGAVIMLLAIFMIVGGIICVAIGFEYDLYILGYILISIGAIALDGAIALLIMSSIFEKKAENREKLISECKNKKQNNL